MAISAVGRNSSPVFRIGESRGITILWLFKSNSYPVDNLPPQVSPLRGRGIIKPAKAHVKPLRCAPDGAALRGFPVDAGEGGITRGITGELRGRIIQPYLPPLREIQGRNYSFPLSISWGVRPLTPRPRPNGSRAGNRTGAEQ